MDKTTLDSIATDVDYAIKQLGHGVYGQRRAMDALNRIKERLNEAEYREEHGSTEADIEDMLPRSTEDESERAFDAADLASQVEEGLPVLLPWSTEDVLRREE